MSTYLKTLVAILLLLNLHIIAQAAQPSSLLTLEIHYSHGAPTNAHLEFLEDFIEILEQDNINAQLHPSSDATATLSLEFITIDELPAVTIGIEAADYNAPSPQVYGTHNQSYSFALPADKPDITLVQHLATYAVGICDEAMLTDAGPGFLAGNCQLQKQEYDAAINSYLSLLDDSVQEEGVVVNNLAWAYLQTGQPEMAQEYMTQLVESVDTSAVTYSAEQHARILADAGAIHALAFDFDSAITYLTTTIELAENSKLPQETIATLYKQRGDHIFLIYEWDRVLADYNRAIELNPTYADAYYARGVLFYTQGPRPDALEDFTRFTELTPGDTRIAEAQEYISSIIAELEALGGDDIQAFPPGG